MKNYLTYIYQLVVIVSFANILTVDGQWEQDTFPTSITPQKLYAYDNDTALVSCTKSTVYKTTDGGQTWFDISPQEIPSENLLDLSFKNKLGAIIAFDTLLFTTSNLGRTWDINGLSNIKSAFKDNLFDLDSSLSNNLTAVHLINDTSICLSLRIKDKQSIYHSFILYSADFGHTWKRVSTDVANGASLVITTIKFSGNIGYAIGSKGTVLKSSDNGLSWTEKTVNKTIGTNYLSDFEILGLDSLLLSSTQVGIILLHNNLDSAEVLLNGKMNDILPINDSLYVAVGNNAETYRSIDAGASWQLANNGKVISTFEVSEFNNRIYAFASKGRYLTVAPEEFYTPSGDFSINTDDNKVSVSCFDNAGENYLWKLTGDTTSIKTAPSAEFTVFKEGDYSIELISTNTLGEFKSEKKVFSVDAVSYQWETTTFPTTENISEIVTFTPNNAALFANKSTILYSIDAGLNWQKSSIPEDIVPQICNSAKQFNDSTAFASYTGSKSNDGYILYTTNKGISWSKALIDIPQMHLDAYSYFRIYAANSVNDSLALAMVRYIMADSDEEFYSMIKSNDMGKTWTSYTPYNFGINGYSSVINNISADKNTKKIIVSGIKTYWLSFDSGQNWEVVDATDMGSINDIISYGSNYIFATQKGIFNVGNSSTDLLSNQYAFDAIFTPDSLLISGRGEATIIADKNGQNWIPFGEGIYSTYYDYANLGGWIYALRKGTESYRTPISFAEQQRALIDDVDVVTYNNTTAIYPNPAQKARNIYLTNTELNYTEVTVYDIAGKVISHHEIINNCFVAPYASGIYIIDVLSDETKNTFKLVID